MPDYEKSVVYTYTVFSEARAFHTLRARSTRGLSLEHLSTQSACMSDKGTAAVAQSASIHVEAVPGFGTRGYAVPLFLLLCLRASVPRLSPVPIVGPQILRRLPHPTPPSGGGNSTRKGGLAVHAERSRCKRRRGIRPEIQRPGGGKGEREKLP